MNPLNDGIVHSAPVLGQKLFVEDCSGEIVNCGVVIACEFRTVLKSGDASPLYATMVFIRTTEHSDGFSVFPGPDLPVPSLFRDTVRREVWL